MVKKAKEHPKRSTVKRKASASGAGKRTDTKKVPFRPRQHLADVARLIPDPVMIISSSGKVIAWNRAMEILTGVKAKDMVGRGNYEYALPFYGERRPVLADIAMKPAEEIERVYKHIARKGNTLIAEALVSLPQGPATVFGSATLLKNSRGNTIGVLEIVCDITGVKKP